MMVELLIGHSAGSRTDDDLITEIDHSSPRADPVDVREAIEMGANGLAGAGMSELGRDMADHVLRFFVMARCPDVGA